MNTQRSQSSVSKWGWNILLVISALLVLNAVALFSMSARPSTFETDTGVPMSEVREMFPIGGE